jgi:hypothetical protein
MFIFVVSVIVVSCCQTTSVVHGHDGNDVDQMLTLESQVSRRFWLHLTFADIAPLIKNRTGSCPDYDDCPKPGPCSQVAKG